MMKIALVFVLAFCSFAFAFPKPADDNTEETKSDDPSTETEFVNIPLENGRRQPSYGFGIALPDVFNGPRDSFGQNPFGQDPFYRGSPFGGASPAGGEVDDFMTQMQDMLREMRKQLTDLVKHAHEHAGVDGDDTSVGTRIGEGDLPQNKTTSTTKVIDGHVVTVNETTYSSGDDSIGAVLRVKVVDIHPIEDDGTKSDEPTSSEIPNVENKSELDEDKHEETNEIPNAVQKVNYEWHPEFDPSFNEIDYQELSYQPRSPMKEENYYDLTDDTKVNDYISDQQMSQGLVKIDPDAEIINTDVNSHYGYDRTPQRLQRFSY